MLHTRLTNWLTAILVVLWPAAAAQACCCTAGAESASGKCPPGCCAAQADAGDCCGSRTAEQGGMCCATSAEQKACGCSQQCGTGEPRHAPAGAIEKKSSSAPPAAFVAATWHADWPAYRDAAALDWDATTLPQRPNRILFSVWRN